MQLQEEVQVLSLSGKHDNSTGEMTLMFTFCPNKEFTKYIYITIMCDWSDEISLVRSEF